MFSGVRAITHYELIIIVLKLQRGRHLLIRERPVPVLIIQIARSVLQEYPNRFPFCLADHRLIIMPSANIHEAPNMTEHFAGAGGG